MFINKFVELKNRYNKGTIFSKVGFWGSAASIIALLLTVFFFFLSSSKNHFTPDLTNTIQPYIIEIKENHFEVFSRYKNTLWIQEISGNIVKGNVVDLDNDGKNEVIIGVGSRGDDTGKILCFSANGELIWEFNTTGSFNYEGGRSDKLMVRNFEIVNLFDSEKKQIVILSIDSQGWYQSRLCIIDSRGKLIWT